jgi:isocitrate/methylisocitrate lyase
MSGDRAAEDISRSWVSDERWKGLERPYSAGDVVRLRGSVQIEHTLARMGAEKLWHLLYTEPYIQSTAAVTGQQALQQVQAGLRAINVSGFAVAADGNDAGEVYPDEGLYPVSSVPNTVRRINNAFKRADQISHAEGRNDVDWFVPIKADGEAGFGGVLNTFELTKEMIEAGAAAVSFEDQLPSAKKCGHLGGKVLVPTSEFIQKLIAARLAADVMGVPTILIARTEANNATLLTSDADPRDRAFLTGQRTSEGFFRTRAGLDATIARGLAYAPYADLLWYETFEPSLEEARRFAEAIHGRFPGKLFYYNCSSSFNWKKMLDDATIARFQQELGAMGYKFQNSSFLGFHAMYLGLFQIAKEYRETGMTAFARLQQAQIKALDNGYRGWKLQRSVGTGYFDDVARTVVGEGLSTAALRGSTEESQF